VGAKELSIGGDRYRLVAEARGGQWLAHAERADTGQRFGVECSGATEADAIHRLSAWLEWQSEHAAALDALQRAEHAYHRTIAGSAFAGGTEGPSGVEMQKESLDAVEAARVRLDEIRARKPV
jgi:hypothetical protein